MWRLARWRNADASGRGETPPIPESSIEKPPSAELRPNQTDQDSLPPYDVLDAILKSYVEEGLSRRDLVAQGFAEAVVNDVVRKVDLNEYKRKQAAPGLKITPLAFGLPVAAVVLALGGFVPALRKELPPRTVTPLRETGWYRWSHLIQRRPWPAALAVCTSGGRSARAPPGEGVRQGQYGLAAASTCRAKTSKPDVRRGAEMISTATGPR